MPDGPYTVPSSRPSTVRYPPRSPFRHLETRLTVVDEAPVAFETSTYERPAQHGGHLESLREVDYLARAAEVEKERLCLIGGLDEAHGRVEPVRLAGADLIVGHGFLPLSPPVMALL